MIDTIVIGAGPYGLSIAAHLRGCGMDFRIFGTPMRTWLKNMPKGMRLKSEGFASSLYDPDSTFTLKKYCEERGIAYADTGIPVAIDTFSSYGLEFQKRFVPELEEKQVVQIARSANSFRITLEDGESCSARRVVIAAGLGYFDYTPPVLSQLPQEFVTHSSRHHDLECFRGRQVVVVGAGASAVDLAALLNQEGATVQLVARKPAIKFHDPPPAAPPSMTARLRYPSTGIGGGWKLLFCASAPLAFRRLPEKTRLEAVRKTLGPAPGWFVKDEVVGKVPFHLGVAVAGATIQGGRVGLEVSHASGERKTLFADHVIAATGYRVDLRRLTFLDSGLLKQIREVEQTPLLSSNFESSVPGLYFVGTSAANTFGPLLRFAFGARFTARRLSTHLARVAMPLQRRAS